MINVKTKYWPVLVNILDGLYPKGKSKDRGKALIFLAYVEMALSGTKFNEDGTPIIIDKQGRYCCPNCHKPLKKIEEYQYTCDCMPGINISIG